MLTIDKLRDSIITAHTYFNTNAVKAINISLTLRNWFIGYYIVEYEQKGNDRAKYGTSLLANPESGFKASGIRGLTERRFRDYRRFYHLYPQIRRSITAVLSEDTIRRLPTFVKQKLDK